MEVSTSQLKLLVKLINKYGINAQIIQSLEEFNELQKELIYSLCRVERLNKDNLLSELADVFIMLQQLVIIFDLEPKKIQDEIDFKLNRISSKI